MNLESLQYKALLAISGAVKGSSTERLYQEPGLGSLQIRQWFEKLLSFTKSLKDNPQNIYMT